MMQEKIQNTTKDKSSVNAAMYQYSEMRTPKPYGCEYRVSPKYEHRKDYVYYLVKIMHEKFRLQRQINPL